MTDPQADAAWVRRLLAARGLRGLADGCLSVLLPVYLLALGHEPWAVGLISTATLLGSALLTLALGAWGHRRTPAQWLPWAAVLMMGTGLSFALCTDFWPLLLVAFVGTLNPGSGDVSVFLPLEHAQLAALHDGPSRTRAFARYSIVGALAGAVGALLSAVPDWATSALSPFMALTALQALRAMFVAYALLGLLVWWLVRVPAAPAAAARQPSVPLAESRHVVWRLAALFSVDAFAGGLVVQALMTLWLATRFGLTAGQAGQFFFWSGLLSTASLWLAPRLAQRVGLLNTMVFTHIPANLCLVAAALAPSWPVALVLLLVRSALSQMDVPTRSAFVMAVVTPPERAAAASFTAVPRSLAAACGPTLGGALLAAGAVAAPMVVSGVLKIAYDLALWRAFRQHQAAR